MRNYVSNFPEAFRKLFGSLPEAYTAFEARGLRGRDLCARLFTKKGFGIMLLFYFVYVSRHRGWGGGQEDTTPLGL